MRGCEKRIYYIRDAGSEVFEEAYLVLRRKRRDPGPADDGDMAREAERILRAAGEHFRQTRAPIRRLPSPLAFMLGAASSSALIGTVALIIGLS